MADNRHLDHANQGGNASSNEHKRENDRRPAGGHRPAGAGSHEGRSVSRSDRKPGEYRNSAPRNTRSGEHRPARRTDAEGRPFEKTEQNSSRSVHDRKPYSRDPERKDTRRPDDRRRGFDGKREASGGAGYKAFEHRRGVPRQVEGLPSRRSALNVIRAVTENGAWASTALDKELQSAGLNPKDRRLAARLAYDTLERLYYLDALLNQVMAKQDTDIKLRNILRLGACQLLLEDHIPDNAATDTAVELCREIGLDGLAGVCNGILRNLIRRRNELEITEEDPIRRMSIVCSAPEFLVRYLADDYGLEGAEQILRASGSESALTVRPNRMQLNASQFEELLNKKVWDWEKGELPDSWYVRNAANIAQDTDFLSGHFSIQSEQSQMACLAAAPKRGNMVLDACAAPGGKSCYMAEIMDGTGRVQAWDVREHRTKLIEAQVKRLGLDNVRPMTRDATVLREDMVQSMDVVLLDAPCTGTGEMHDKPDSKYRMKEESREELVALQKVMLDTVSSYVKEGGTLVYSTCSVLKDENERQVAAFLERHHEFEIVPLPESVPERIRSQYGTGVQLLPGVNASGGFYICRMRRKRI